MRTNECWDWKWNSLRWYVLRWRRRKSKCSRQLRSFHVCIANVDTLETCNLMSTGRHARNSVQPYVDRFESRYLCRQVRNLLPLSTGRHAWNLLPLLTGRQTCVPLSTGQHARNLCTFVDRSTRSKRDTLCRHVPTLCLSTGRHA